MANFYLRVPHYVASYFRNKDQQKPISVGGVIRIEDTNPLWPILSATVHNNDAGIVVAVGCFCERQWRKMLHGNHLESNSSKGKSANLNHTKTNERTLSDEEVSLLSGIPLRKGDDSGEYLCLKLPNETYRKNKVFQPTTVWQPSCAGAKKLIAQMTDEFWRVFFNYMDKERDWCIAHDLDRSVMESIERFISRYNIRNSMDNREKMTLKRNYYRKLKSYKFAEESFRSDQHSKPTTYIG